MRPRQIPFLLGLVLLLGAMIITRPSIRGNDGVQNYAYLRSILVDGDLDFTNDYRHYLERQPRWFDHRDLPRDPETGLPMNLYGVGSALMWLPAVALVHGLMHTVAPDQADGFSPPYEWAVGWSTAGYVVAGLWLLFGLLARFAGRLPAAVAILATWLGSPLFFYAHLHGSMSHGCSFFAAVLVARILASRAVAKGRPLAWLALGACGGLLVLVRFQDGVLLSAVAVAELLRARAAAPDLAQRARWLAARIPAYLCAIAAGAAMLSLQGAAWAVLQGGWFTGPRAYVMQGAFRWHSPHLLSTWLSPWHGLFHWHPALLAGVAGLLLAGRRIGPRAVALSAFLAASYVVGCWSAWHAGASFGHRMYISALPALALGLALAFRPTATAVPAIRRRATAAAAAFLAAAIVWNFGLVFQYAMEMIPRNRPVWFTTMAWNTAVEIPRRLIAPLTRQPTTPNQPAIAPPED